MTTKIINEDVLKWAKEYDGPPFMALLTDPPYELGFMGKDWDRSGIAFNPETWAALAEHMLPGAFGMAFASSRGWHRLAVAIEDAGMRIHPSIFGWAFGSGFPKATRLDTQIDKRRPGAFPLIRDELRRAIKASGLSQVKIKRHLGYPEDSGVISHWVANSQPDIPTSKDWWKLHEIIPLSEEFDSLFVELEREEIGIERSGIGTAFGDGEWARGQSEEYMATTATHSLARAWEGHRYGLQALKPALEPIIVFQKPYKGKPVDSITETGAGALNIDGARIPGEPWKWGTQTDIRGGGYDSKRPSDGNVLARNVESNPLGRWPANFVLDEETARRLGQQRGESKSAYPGRQDLADAYAGTVVPLNGATSFGGAKAGLSRSDTGTAARFFLNVDWQLEESDPVLYCPKASRKERDAGLEDLPEKPAGAYGEFAGDGRGRQTEHIPARNNHPTVKPLKLDIWLSTLLLPPAEYAPRRILVPFLGSGSEAIGAMLAGWEDVVGIEMEKEYCDIAEARIEYWGKRAVQLPLMADE